MSITLFVFMAMVFFNIVNDYYLQNKLNLLKQEKWWKDNQPDNLYRKDHIAALIMNSISWSFMVTLPLVIHNRFNVGTGYLCLIIFNTTVHAFIDNMKVNDKTINLVQEQLFHLCQIIFTIIIVLLLGL